MGKYTAIDDPSAYFTTTLWTGNGADNRALTNDANAGNFKPDWVWVKGRSAAEWHNAYDSSRGANKGIYPNDTYQEESLSETLESFDTNGFTVSYNSAYSSVFTNKNSTTYVGWQWKCNGGTTASNTDGDINSTVQVNQDAGFSIVTYTGNGSTSDQTIGHGLGVRANAVIVKNRDSGVNWVVWSEGVDANHSLELNTTDGISDSTQGRVLSNAGSRGTSTIFSIRSGSGSVVQTNTSGEDYVAYCFAEKQGFSKFGSYIGNLVLDGPFVYTGFKPAFVMIKRAAGGTSSYSSWAIHDSKRYPFNDNLAGNKVLWANGNYAEGTRGQGGNNTGATANLDLLSNGFKIRDNGSDEINDPNDTYIYMAFAENPFVTSTGIMGTAR